MIEVYLGFTLAFAIVALISTVFNWLEFAESKDSYWKRERTPMYARRTLLSLAAIILAPLWPVLLPLALGYGILSLYRAAYLEEDE